MKVILKQDVKALGKAGDVKEVNDGYARNFLLPKGLATEATASQLNELQQKTEAAKFHKQQQTAQMKELADTVNNTVLTVKAKVGDGKLFGSITSKEIADELAKTGIEIDKKKIVLKTPIKSLGSYVLEVKLYPSITAKLKVEVVGS